MTTSHNASIGESSSDTRATAAASRPPWHRRPLVREAGTGWLFVSPAVVVFLLFFVTPIVMAVWVSLLEWNGQSNPLNDFEFVGLENYRRLLDRRRTCCARTSRSALRNTVYFVAVFVPAVAALSFSLALIVNSRVLQGRGFFRTAFYFPSITSSVAISMTFLFLFQGTGVINTILSWFGIDGPVWFHDARGLVHIVLDGLGLVDPQRRRAGSPTTTFLGLSWWQWFAGPSVAMCALLVLPSGRRRAPSCCSSWPACRTSRRISTRPAPSMARDAGSASATSPCR